jgi:hypothetical protein
MAIAEKLLSQFRTPKNSLSDEAVAVSSPEPVYASILT